MTNTLHPADLGRNYMSHVVQLCNMKSECRRCKAHAEDLYEFSCDQYLSKTYVDSLRSSPPIIETVPKPARQHRLEYTVELDGQRIELAVEGNDRDETLKTLSLLINVHD